MKLLTRAGRRLLRKRSGTAAVGLALMRSAHPGLVALEMAAAGA